jgi:hypothetical protein
MSGSKKLVEELCTDSSSAGYVTFWDSSRSMVLGLGKVVISHDVTIEDVMLIGTLSYNLLFVAQLANMGFALSLMLRLWFFCGESLLK